MSGESIDIRNQDGALLGPGCSADSPSVADAGAGYGALKGTQREPLLVLHQVESDPEKAESLAKGCGGVCQHGDKVCFAFQKQTIVGQELFVRLGLCESRGE